MYSVDIDRGECSGMVKNMRRVWQATALVVVGGLAAALTACSLGQVSAEQPGQDTSRSSEVAPEPDIPVVSVEDGATGVNPAEPVTVTAPGDGLAEVEMRNEEDKVVEAELGADGTWTTTEELGYNRTYTLEARAEDGTEVTTSFATTTPAATTGVALVPIPDSTVGVGQAINFIFTTAPTDREAVEDAITIETSNDTVGDFYWVSANDLRWRPKDFWEPGTEVNVDVDLYGLDMGDGLFGNDDNATNFTIGDDVRAIVDDHTKTMDVYRNGELLRSIPVSLGRDTEEWATPNGTYVVGDEYSELMMDSATFGLPVSEGGYETLVDHATQLSYSGIYVHSAPWSVAQQGNSNTSHGCINVTPEAAAWFQETVKRGDPVIVQNTVGGTVPGYDGLGHWNIDWETWEAGA